MNTDKTQNEICSIVGVTPPTLTKWSQDGMWRELKGATTITASNITANIYKKMFEMTTGEGELKADALAKLARVIEVISNKRYTISQMYNVFKAFTNWLFPKDTEAAKMLNRYMKEFVDDQIKNYYGGREN